MTPEAFVDDAPYPILLLSYLNATAGNGSIVDFMQYGRSNMRLIYQLRTEVECIAYVGPEEQDCNFPSNWSNIWRVWGVRGAL